MLDLVSVPFFLVCDYSLATLFLWCRRLFSSHTSLSCLSVPISLASRSPVGDYNIPRFERFSFVHPVVYHIFSSFTLSVNDMIILLECIDTGR